MESAQKKCDDWIMWKSPAALILSATLLSGCDKPGGPAKACTPPQATWRQPHPHLGPDIAIVHVSLDRNGDVYFDGKKTTLEQLPSDLEIVPRMGLPEPATIFETEMGAPCETLNKVRSIMNRQLKCDQGAHCDEGIQTIWEDLPNDSGVVP